MEKITVPQLQRYLDYRLSEAIDEAALHLDTLKTLPAKIDQSPYNQWEAQYQDASQEFWRAFSRYRALADLSDYIKYYPVSKVRDDVLESVNRDTIESRRAAFVQKYESNSSIL